MIRALVMAAAVALAAATPVSTGDQEEQKPRPVTHRVTIDATSFRPSQLTIRVGDSVVWMNRDVIPHTATESAEKGFDSGTLGSGDAWKHTFKTAGDIAYICSFHPTMKGQVKVQ